MKTLLITGGAGFIGSNFIRYIRHHYPQCYVIVLDALTYAGRAENVELRSRRDVGVLFCHGNVCDPNLVDRLVSLSDVVVHFAAESHVARSIIDDRVFFETDVLGTRTVANAVVRYQSRVERFVHISSSEVYGTAEHEPMDEEHPLNATNPYAAAKVGADRLVYAYWCTFRIPAVIVRPFNTYGPCQHLEKVIPRFITSCILDEPLTIHGPGTAARDWLYVDDHCAALDRVLHGDIARLEGQVINIGTGIATSVSGIAERILRLTGKPATLIEHVPDRPGQVCKHIAGIEKARTLLGWAPTTPLDDGLAETVRWYEANRDWWEPLRSMRRIPVLMRNGVVEMH